MQFVHVSPPERAPEIGCGDGRMTKNLAELSGSVVAMDIAPTVLDACRRNLHAAHNVDFVLGSVDAFAAFADDYFDFILSTTFCSMLRRGRQLRRTSARQLGWCRAEELQCFRCAIRVSAPGSATWPST